MISRHPKTKMPRAIDALRGRPNSVPVPEHHFVNGNRMVAPFPEGLEKVLFGMGCFWGAEKVFWQHEGVYATAAGYAGGFTRNATYKEVCSGRTGHNEVVQIVFHPEAIGFDRLLGLFFENHDPTQGMRQGNDVGTQYRSGIYCFDEEQLAQARAAKSRYQEALIAASKGPITTEIVPAPEFFYAEEYHQQYLAKNPGGYCGLGGTGVSCPSGVL